jgi:hypothetical protein
MKRFVVYQNGNYRVTLDTKTGTKLRETEENEFIADFPESMDIKICNRCDLNCPQCHECSTPDGECGDLLTESFIDHLHPYTELAIGGGNPLEHPQLEHFLYKCKALNLIPNMTVNQLHFIKHYDYIKALVDNKLIYGLGISLMAPTDEFISLVSKIPTAVIHTIVGLTATPDNLSKLAQKNLKVLILGYKNYGRGKNFGLVNDKRIKDNLMGLKKNLPTYLWDEQFDVVSFDNLALIQLKVEEECTPEEWEFLYMGDDGTATMYVDMVKREFARTSTSEERFPLEDRIETMFQKIRK